jgi:hypothetical protein
MISTNGLRTPGSADQDLLGLIGSLLKNKDVLPAEVASFSFVEHISNLAELSVGKPDSRAELEPSLARFVVKNQTGRFLVPGSCFIPVDHFGGCEERRVIETRGDESDEIFIRISPVDGAAADRAKYAESNPAEAVVVRIPLGGTFDDEPLLGHREESGMDRSGKSLTKSTLAEDVETDRSLGAIPNRATCAATRDRLHAHPTPRRLPTSVKRGRPENERRTKSATCEFSKLDSYVWRRDHWCARPAAQLSNWRGSAVDKEFDAIDGSCFHPRRGKARQQPLPWARRNTLVDG